MTQIRSKHSHHIIIGSFKRFGSRQIYSEFEKVANKFTTLKFVDFTDLEYLKKNFPNVKESFEN